MPSLLRRRRVLVAAVVVAIAVAAFGVALARSRTPGCAVAPPDTPLPAQLRTLGEFSQPLDTTDERSMADAAVHAAGALHQDLTGAQPDRPVMVAAASPAVHDALVVPLSESSSTGGSTVVGLVVFLEDCSGRGYFSQVADLLLLDPSRRPPQYPTVGADLARATLGVQTVRLVYRRTPLQPLWQDPDSLRSVAAAPQLP